MRFSLPLSLPLHASLFLACALLRCTLRFQHRPTRREIGNLKSKLRTIARSLPSPPSAPFPRVSPLIIGAAPGPGTGPGGGASSNSGNGMIPRAFFVPRPRHFRPFPDDSRYPLFFQAPYGLSDIGELHEESRDDRCDVAAKTKNRRGNNKCTIENACNIERRRRAQRPIPANFIQHFRKFAGKSIRSLSRRTNDAIGDRRGAKLRRLNRKRAKSGKSNGRTCTRA